jgi:hypothetical protein
LTKSIFRKLIKLVISKLRSEPKGKTKDNQNQKKIFVRLLLKGWQGLKRIKIYNFVFKFCEKSLKLKFKLFFNFSPKLSLATYLIDPQEGSFEN